MNLVHKPKRVILVQVGGGTDFGVLRIILVDLATTMVPPDRIRSLDFDSPAAHPLRTRPLKHFLCCHGFRYTLAVKVVVCAMLEDAWNYFQHRALHDSRVYKHVHKVHHHFSAPFGLTAEYLHPAENVREYKSQIVKLALVS